MLSYALSGSEMTSREEGGWPPGVSVCPFVSELRSLAHVVHNVIQTPSHMWTKGQPQPQQRSPVLTFKASGCLQHHFDATREERREG